MAYDFIPTWANAIAQQEGFGNPGNRPTRNNNPGDLKYAGQSGATGKDSAGFAIFPDASTGFQALYNQLSKYISNFPNFSILDITAHYLGQASPTSDAQGNAFTYAAAVAGALGVDPSTTLSELATGQPPSMPVPGELTADASGQDLISPDVLSSLPVPAPSAGMGIGALALLGVGAFLLYEALT